MSAPLRIHIPFSRFLQQDGSLADDAPDVAFDISLLQRYLKHMLFVRTLDRKIVALQRTGKIGTYPSCLGQEAIGTAIGTTMLTEDVFVPYYRDQAAQLLRGVTLVELLRYWGGDERGNAYTVCQEDFPPCVPIATQITHAAGIATAFKIRKQPRVAVVTCGDGATSRGDFYESLNLAGVWQLPLVLVINNNQWAISVPRELQSATKTLAEKALATGVPGEQVDGNDPIAMHQAMTAALARARSGKGASVIEAISYRLGDHTTADDATRYRTHAELTEAWKAEPIARLRQYLITNSAWDNDAENEWIAESQTAIETAIQAYMATPAADIDDMFDYLYEELPANLARQKVHMQRKTDHCTK